MNNERLTILCLASHEKGADFLRALKEEGCRVLLLTREKEATSAWPMEVVDERFLLPNMHDQREIIHAVSYLARHIQIDALVALDDLDVEMAAGLREHLRMSGMGSTTARRFRDKLAMRVQAREAGIRVPAFVHALNHERMRHWMEATEPPWLLKPRSEASSVGIKRIDSPDALWPTLDALGDCASYYVLEQFVHGPVFHVDGLVWDGAMIFGEAHGYLAPPLSVMQGGGIFRSATLSRESRDSATLLALTQRLVVDEFGLARGAFHTEWIKNEANGDFYFLETAARVGGANLADMVQAATGISLWREWARLEVAALRGQPYTLPPRRHDYAAILISLARQEWPDLSRCDAPEVRWRMQRRHHAGLIVASDDPRRIATLIDAYTQRFIEEFVVALPPRDTLYDRE